MRIPDDCKPFVQHLSESEQYWWGAAGGFFVVFMTLIAVVEARRSTPKARRKPLEFLDFLFAFLWAGFPFVAGGAARVIKPHSELQATFDGVGLLIIYYYVAQHLRGVIQARNSHDQPPTDPPPNAHS